MSNLFFIILNAPRVIYLPIASYFIGLALSFLVALKKQSWSFVLLYFLLATVTTAAVILAGGSKNNISTLKGWRCK
jgi:hypothetical protein